jgi:hypothetical protein
MVTGATSYNVYRETSPISSEVGLTPIATPASASWTDFVSANGTYWYAVVASNSSCDSPVSNSVNVTAAIPPAANPPGSGNSNGNPNNNPNSQNATNPALVYIILVAIIGAAAVVAAIIVIKRRHRPRMRVPL